MQCEIVNRAGGVGMMGITLAAPGLGGGYFASCHSLPKGSENKRSTVWFCKGTETYEKVLNFSRCESQY